MVCGNKMRNLSSEWICYGAAKSQEPKFPSASALGNCREFKVLKNDTLAVSDAFICGPQSGLQTLMN